MITHSRIYHEAMFGNINETFTVEAVLFPGDKICLYYGDL